MNLFEVEFLFFSDMCPGVKLLGPMLVLHFLFCWPVSMGCLPPNSRQWKGFFQSGLGRLEGFSAEVIFKQGLQGLGGASWLDHKQRQVSPWGREESAQELKGETCGAGVLSTGTGAQNWRVRQGPLGDTAAGESVFTHNAEGRYLRTAGRS